MTKLALALSALLGLVLAITALWPGFDLDVARMFYVGTDHFVGATPAGIVVRYTAWALPFVLLAAMAAAWLLARLAVLSERFAPSSRSLVVLIAGIALAPGLIVHATLKEISHRPRPYAVTEFGGPDCFRPFYRFDGACRHNCAFPSGETAVATWTLAPASLVPPPWRALALAGALAFTVATGGLRMAFGAHFLSDVAAAALITVLVVAVGRHLDVRGHERDGDDSL